MKLQSQDPTPRSGCKVPAAAPQACIKLERGWLQVSLQRQARLCPARGRGGPGAPSSPHRVSACPFPVLQRVLHQLIHPPPLPEPCGARHGEPPAGLLQPGQRACGFCKRQWGPGLPVPAQPSAGPPPPRGGAHWPLPPQARPRAGCGGQGFGQQCWGAGGTCGHRLGNSTQACDRSPRERASTWPSARRKSACTSVMASAW